MSYKKYLLLFSLLLSGCVVKNSSSILSTPTETGLSTESNFVSSVSLSDDSTSSPVVEGPIGDVVSFINSLNVNYTLTIEDAFGDYHLDVTEYGVYDSYFNAENGSLIRAGNQRVYFGKVINDDITFILNGNVSYQQYLTTYNPANWKSGSLGEQFSIVDLDKGIVSSPVLYDSMTQQYGPTVGSYFASIGKLGGIVLSVEFKVTDHTVSDIVMELNPAYSMYSVESIKTPSGKASPMAFSFSKIGTTSFLVAKNFYESGALPTFGTTGFFSNLQNELHNYIGSVADLIPTISGELDYQIIYTEDGPHYYTRTIVGIFNLGESDVLNYLYEINDVAIDFDSRYGFILQDEPRFVIYASYSPNDDVFVLNIFLQKSNTWPSSDLSLFSHQYGDVDIPELNGAIYYKFIRSGTATIEAYFHSGFDIEAQILLWEETLKENGWGYINTSTGSQLQDSSHNISVVFIPYSDYVAITFYQATAPTGYIWPHQELANINRDVLIEVAGTEYAFQYYLETWHVDRVAVTVVSPVLEELNYEALYTLAGWTRVFSDPLLATDWAFISPDNEWIISITYNIENHNTLLTIILEPYDPSYSLTQPKPYDTVFPIAKLAGYVGYDVAYAIPIPEGENEYLVTLTRYMFGYDSYGIHVKGLGISGVNAYITNFINIGWVLDSSTGVYYNSLNPGVGISIINYLDGTFIIGGAKLFEVRDTYNQAFSYVVGKAIDYYPTYASNIASVANTIPNMGAATYSAVQIYSINNSTINNEIDVLEINEASSIIYRDSITSLANWVSLNSPYENYPNVLWSKRGYLPIPGTSLWFEMTISYVSDNIDFLSVIIRVH
jgi:hypothetical protein